MIMVAWLNEVCVAQRFRDIGKLGNRIQRFGVHFYLSDTPDLKSLDFFDLLVRTTKLSHSLRAALV